jgi:hypothetical protein
MNSFFRAVSTSEAWKNGHLVDKKVLVNDNGNVVVYDNGQTESFDLNNPPKLMKASKKKTRKRAHKARRKSKKYGGNSFFNYMARHGRQGSGEKNSLAHEKCNRVIRSGNFKWPSETDDELTTTSEESKKSHEEVICGDDKSEMYVDSEYAPRSGFFIVPVSKIFHEKAEQRRKTKRENHVEKKI